MKRNFTLLLAVAIVCLLSVTSCKKEDDENVQSAEDNAQIETEYSQVFDMVANYLSVDPKTRKTESNILSDDAEVIFTDTTFDDGDGVDFTIDYGPVNNGSAYKGVQCKDRRYRAGKIHVGISDRWGLTPCTLTFAISTGDNYYIGNGASMFQVTGNARVEHVSTDSFTFVVTDATLHRDNGTAQWSCDRKLKVTSNVSAQWLNNEYDLTGTASGTAVNGQTFAVENVTPLHKRIAYGCLSTFVTGKLTVTTSGKQEDLNYDVNGRGECDNIITAGSKDVTLW
jgi:hypothetical protein